MVHSITRAFALVALLAGASWAADPLVGAQFRDFSGALNDSQDPLNLQPKDSPDLLNVVVDDPIGSIRPRGGLTQCGNLPSGSVATALFNYSRADGGQFIVAADNTNVYQTQNCTTWTRILDGQNSQFKPDFAVVRNNLWIVNGSTHPYTWDGSTTTILDGRANTPNPTPARGRYVAFWKERVWLARTLADPSILAWSALTDSSGNDLNPSTGTLSWPATNAVYVDRDAGSPIYGIKVYRDNLYVFKDNGIWRIAFNNDFDIAIIKTLSSVGCRFGSSIVELDNLLYFTGPDGIYAFDGDNSTRLSDKIANRFASISQPTTSEGQKIWTDEGDFDNGTVFNTTWTVASGSVILSTATASLSGGDFEAGALTGGWRCVSIPNGPLGCNVYASTASVPSIGTVGATQGNYSAALVSAESGTANRGYQVIGVDGSTKTAMTFLNNTASNNCYSASTETIDASAYAGSVVYLKFSSFDDELWSPAFTVGGQISFAYTATNNSDSALRGIQCLDNITATAYQSTGIYTTDVYQAVSRSSWSVFDAESRLNGGSISYFYRLGGSAASILNTTWTAISPGVSPSNNVGQDFIQFSATMTASAGQANTPYIDSLSIAYAKGGSQSSTIYGGRWKNRYWMTSNSDDFLSTKSSTYSWDGSGEWTTGTLTNIDTTTAPGFIAAGSTETMTDNFGDGNYTASPIWSVGSGVFTVTSNKLTPNSASAGNNTIYSSSTYTTGEWRFNHSYSGCQYTNALGSFGGGNRYGLVFGFMDNAPAYDSAVNKGGAYYVQLYTRANLANPDYQIDLSTTAFDNLGTQTVAHIDIASHVITAGNYNEGTHAWRITRNNAGQITVYIDGTRYLQATNTLISSSTRLAIGMEDYNSQKCQQIDDLVHLSLAQGEWRSDIKTDSGIFDYDDFKLDGTANGGTIVYSYRTANSVTDIASVSFTTMTNGTVPIFTSTSSHLQTRVVLTPADTVPGGLSPMVSSMSIVYTNREQQTDSLNNMVLVNGKYDKAAWVPYDLMIGPMIIYGDNFYAAASTHSAVYRMDYGNNDAGMIIPWYWTSRDEVWGQPSNRKRLMEITTDFRKATGASSVQIGYSRDQGVTFTNSSISMDGSGRATNRRFVGGFGYDFRLRFGSTSLDVAPTITGITGWSAIQTGRQ